ncbi:MAG: hypothetical protein KatS3mg005_2323 [Bryobacteraceae bacterium]|nr:MAG: hypothetical protein KatS3mg005_2323 [Bryobacteraceae bacterium]
METQRSTGDRTAAHGRFGVIRSRAAASRGDGPSADARAWPAWLRMAALLLVLALGGAVSAEAAIFTAAAAGCTNDFGSGLGAQNVATSRSDCSGGWSYGSANAQANGHGLHANAEGYHYCCASAGGFAASANVATQYMIIGPPGSPDVPISLNFVLSGSVGGGSTPGYSGRFIRAELSLEYAGWYFIEFGEISNGPDGLSYWYSSNLSSPSNYLPGACIRCRATTLQATVPVNRPLNFYMGLQAWVGQFGDAYGFANASNTLYFPLEGAVFNLPEGYSAVIYGMNVEGNRVVGLDNGGGGGGEIPEPGTMALIGAGLLALGAASRFRRPHEAS